MKRNVDVKSRSKPGASGHSGDFLCFPFFSRLPLPSPSKVQLPQLHFNKKGGSDRAPPLPVRIPPSCSAGCIMSITPALRRQQDSCASESRPSTVSSRPLKLYRFLVSQTTEILHTTRTHHHCFLITLATRKPECLCPGSDTLGTWLREGRAADSMGMLLPNLIGFLFNLGTDA